MSSDVNEKKHVDTPSHSISREYSLYCLHTVVIYDFIYLVAKPLEKQFLEMLAEFLNILTRFVNQIFKQKQSLKDVKTWLSGIGHNEKERKEIDEVHDESGLMRLLRSYCSLREFSIVTSLAKNANMADIVQELNQFEEKREKLYKEILAKDFARSAIEYCGTTGSREVRLIICCVVTLTFYN